MRPGFAEELRCSHCQGQLLLEVLPPSGGEVGEGVLRSPCGRFYPVIRGVPRILPPDLAASVLVEHADFFRRHPGLVPGSSGEDTRPTSSSTLRAFGDEWRRFPAIEQVHEQIFQWYFEGPQPVRWEGLRVLDAGCGMGRWLHFARRAGADVVGMDVSPAIDVAAQREGADFVQSDLRYPPFPPASFDMVYSLGVVHHLEDPMEGLRALAGLVRPGGELRLYVYRSLQGESWPRRTLLAAVSLVRRLTTRLPYWAVQGVAAVIAVLATAFFLEPRRLLRRFAFAERFTRRLPLVHYADVPFRMLVAEQFDRLVAPIEGRYRADEIEAWVKELGFELRALLPELGWRVIARRPGHLGTEISRVEETVVSKPREQSRHDLRDAS
jgi:SAM-dependent methyltransferase/uncharacterized protein YbaR (Trm112 family)